MTNDGGCEMSKQMTNDGARANVTRFVRAVLVEREAEPAAANALMDPFSKWYADKQVIEPPHPMEGMSVMPQYSDTLWPVIDALATNIERTGFSLVKVDPDLDDDNAEVSAEYVKAKAFVDSATFGAADDLEGERVKWRWDLESTGCGYFEVIRDRRTQEPSWFQHVPSYSMRLVKADTDATLCDAYRRDVATGKLEAVKVRRRFRRFVQIVDGSTTNAVWFKEFGDPRGMDRRTGEYRKADPNSDDEATEIIFKRHYAPNTPYGVSPFAGVMYAVAGNTKADKLNLDYFENPIPPVVVMVSGGALTPESFDAVTRGFKERKGKNPWQALLLEAVPTEAEAPADLLGSGSSPGGQVRISIESLKHAIPNDALFTKYKRTNQEDIRCVRRVPAVVVGRTEEYTRATAGAGLEMFEQQVCVHARKVFGSVMNTLLQALGISFWAFESNAGHFSDAADLADLAKVAIDAGVGDIDTWASVFEPLFGVEFPRNDAWKGIPFAMLMKLVEMGLVGDAETSPLDLAGDQLAVLAEEGQVPEREAQQALTVVRLIMGAKAKAERLGLVGGLRRAQS